MPTQTLKQAPSLTTLFGPSIGALCLEDRLDDLCLLVF